MVPTFLPFWPQHIAFFHTHMHHWLQSTVQWVCLSKHPPGYGWKWQRSYQIHSQMLGRGKHQLKANNQKWNVKSCVQIWILTTCLHESQKVWNRSYSRVWTTNESNRHQKKQAAMTVSILTCQCHPASLCFLFGIRLEKKLHLRLGRCSVHTDEGCHL